MKHIFYNCKITVILVFLLFMFGCAKKGVDKNCLGYWQMDDNAANTTVLDSSRYGRNGVAQRTTKERSVGSVNRALSFNGVSDSIVIPDVPYIAKSDFSISLWVNCKSIKPDSLIIVLGSKEARKSIYFYVDNINKIHFGTWGMGPPLVPSIDASKTFDGTWHLLTGIKKADELSIYLDAVKRDSKILPDMDISKEFLSIGGFGGQFFLGALDNVQIFDKALSNDQIQQLYQKKPF